MRKRGRAPSGLFLACALAASTAAGAAPSEPGVKRSLVVLGPYSLPLVREQAKLLRKGAPELTKRDVEVLGEQKANGLLHKRFGQGEGFLLVLVGKDGEEKLRSTKPLSVAELTRQIDAMPMGKEEAAARKDAKSP